MNDIMNNADFALGGIASGFLKLDGSGKVTAFCPAPSFECASPLEIRLVLDGKAHLLLSGENNAECEEKFPFCIYKMAFEKIDVTLTAFNPFLPLNCADSQIPAVLFEIQVKNNSANAVNAVLDAELGDIFGSNGSFTDGVNSISLKLDCENEYVLDAGQTKIHKLCLGWHFPYDNDSSLQKNYYSQYFVNAEECVDYCFKHYQRLMLSSKAFNNMLYTNPMVSNDEMYSVVCELKSIRAMQFVRKNNGIMYCVGNDKDWARKYSEISSLAYLFPELDLDCVRFLLKNTDNNDAQMRMFTVLCAYRNFIYSGNVDELIENWYYISKSLDVDEMLPQSALYTVCLYACNAMAQAVKDRVKKARYEKQYMMAKKTLAATQRNVDEALKHMCYTIGCRELCENFAPKGISALYGMGGFEYNASTGAVTIDPVEDYFNEHYDFKSFYCISSGYGYIQAGVDSLEIKPVFGKVLVRSVKVSRKPRMVLYGGRKWRFVEKDGQVVLDNLLEITPDKILCVVVDAAKTI